MAKVGLIIPVYNSEKTLDYCLESIFNQTFRDFEVIVVDDGSSDKSLEKLESFKEKSKVEFKIYSKENGGAASARKYGLDRLDSDFVFFMDSDDYIDKDTLDVMTRFIEESDTNICNSRVAFHLNLPVIKKIPFKNKARKSKIDLAVEKKYLPMINVITNGKLYRRSYIDITDKYFKANEDLSTNYYLFAKARKISYCNDVTYHYVPNNNGLVNNHIAGYTWDRLQNTFLPLMELKEKFKSNGLLDDYYFEVEQLFIKNIFQRVDYVCANLEENDARKLLTDTLYDFLSFNFPNWRDNSYLEEYFMEFEMPDMLSALKNKKRIPDYVETVYDNEKQIYDRYRRLSSAIESKQLVKRKK